MLLKSPGKVLEKSLNKRLSNLYEPWVSFTSSAVSINFMLTSIAPSFMGQFGNWLKRLTQMENP